MPQTHRGRKSRSDNKDGAKILPRLVHQEKSLPGEESEADLLSNAKKILDMFKIQGLLSYRRIHCMPVMRRNGHFSANREMAGMEDLQIYLCNGKTVFMELKSLRGEQSDRQIEREKELKDLRHDYVVIRSVDGLISVLRQRGLSIWAYPG